LRPEARRVLRALVRNALCANPTKPTRASSWALDGHITLWVSAHTNTAPGTYPLTIARTSGSITRSQMLTVTVT